MRRAPEGAPWCVLPLRYELRATAAVLPLHRAADSRPDLVVHVAYTRDTAGDASGAVRLRRRGGIAGEDHPRAGRLDADLSGEARVLPELVHHVGLDAFVEGEA